MRLVSWIGANDLKAVDGAQLGPVASTLKSRSFESVTLLYSYPANQVTPYVEWLSSQSAATVNAFHVELTSPVNFREIYEAAVAHLSRLHSTGQDLSILLSPGTPAMQAVWILLGKTRFPCRFFQSSVEEGVKEVDIPFQLAAEYIPIAKELSSDQLKQLSSLSAPVDAAFDNIITRNPQMQALKSQAQILAKHDVPVLVYGETGTGKELFARAIHNASNRSAKPFIALNCGAIPSDLVDSVLFGHKKGAFTGAQADKPGVFQQANGGTLFLDEFGELELNVQVRLLRVLQEGSFTPVGGTEEISVDVRLIAATHRDLLEAVSKGTFREDLFYRVVVGVLHLPPLREREGDILLLADMLLESIHRKDTSLEHKNLSPDAKNIILRHPWRGNVRELQSTLLRAALWSTGEAISAADIRQALFKMPESTPGLLHRDISQGIDIQQLITDLVQHYIPKAMTEAHGNKTRAAELLGLKNYQTLNNWIEKYQIE